MIQRSIPLLTAAALLFHSVQLGVHLPDLPRNIPIHFTNTVPDKWGSKYFPFLLPVIGILSWRLIGLLKRRPEKLNYINLTEKNKKIQYERAVLFLVVIQNTILLIVLSANQDFLMQAAGREVSFYFYTAIGLMAALFFVCMYQLFWAALLRE